ncbi:ATP-binding protein [Sphingobium sufflavum]|uniref:two-component system sensor histidine kinase NtrB n=1 Tax=Sphingobium sufflavum TaxID=1129547 RepID=UPI001F1EF29F|nr:ATP-binding protein [Sphingobium sufflavum]MCE7797973.1 ATP-binding protein [Sphingobium sufflavum]
MSQAGGPGVARLVSGEGVSVRDGFSSHPVATLIIDDGDLIVSANPRAESLLNMARSALIGSRLTDVLRLDDPAMDPSFWHTDKPLSAYDVRLYAGRSDAVEMDILINPLSDAPGWRVLAMHIHSQSHAIGFRRAPSGAMSAMGAAAMLAHEIKNPLSGIRGAAQLIQGELAEGNHQLTGLIVAEVDRIASLIDRMQGFTTEQQQQAVTQNIYPLLDRAVDVALAGFGSGVRLDRQYDPSLPDALVDADRLVQVMINLLKNAVEAVQDTPGARVVVTTAFKHGFSIMRSGSRAPVTLPIEIQVMDNGPGVKENIRDVLFNPFITTKRTGQGLGLALVDKLVRDMGGLVQYERINDKGKGKAMTVFRLLLPKGANG